jgi:hypothetical protein
VQDEPSATAELLWIVGYRSEVTDATGTAPAPDELMCHTALDTNAQRYRETFGSVLTLRGNRLFSVDQGTFAIDLPRGFGIPIMSDEEIFVATQVLNHNIVGDPFDVRERVTIDYVRHRDLDAPLRPLVQHGVFGMVLVDGPDGHVGLAPAAVDTNRHGPGCAMALDRGDPRGQVTDAFGRRLSSFWVVEPGRHVYHTRVTDFLDLPYDTRLHLAAAHLHPFAESLALYDLTTDEAVVELRTQQRDGRIGLAAVETLSSEEGVPLFADHEYDLVAVYDNDSGVDQDAMATLLMYLELRDVSFALAGALENGRLWVPAVPTPF